MQSPHPDHRFIEALLQHDNTTINEIYKRFSARVLRFVESNNGSAEDARDVFQEALIIISRQASRPDFILTCPFEAYLYLVCRGYWLNELKRRRRTEVTKNEFGGFQETSEAEALADHTLESAARDLLFQSAFEQLGSICRQLLQLSWTGLTMEEVSRQLGMTYGYARKKKHECTKQLVTWIHSNK